MGAASDTSPRSDHPTLFLRPSNRNGVLLALVAASVAIMALVVYGLVAAQNSTQLGRFFSFVTAWATGAGLVVSGLLVLRQSARTGAGLEIALLCFAQAVFSVGLLFRVDNPTLSILWGIGAVASGVCYALLVLVYPTPHPRLMAQPNLRYVPLLGLLFVVLPMAAFFVGLVLLGLRLLLSRQAGHDYVQVVLVAVGVAFVAALLLVADLQLALPFMALPALSLAYAQFQPRDGGPRLVSHAFSYGVALGGLIVVYYALALGVSVLTDRAIGPVEAGLLGLVVLGLSAFLWPQRNRLQVRLETQYTREQRAYAAEAETFAQQLTLLNAPYDILKAFRERVETGFAPAHLVVFQRDEATNAYAAPSDDTDLRFPADSPLIAHLTSEPVLALANGQSWPSDVLAERARLRVLDAQLILALAGTNGLQGFVVLGRPTSGAGYSAQAVAYLRGLAQQTAVVYERAQVVDGLERRVRELGILSQVSQAVNFTLNADDLLELIATQIERLLDVTHLYIVLRDDAADAWYFAFFLQNDERYSDRENQRRPLGRDLFSEVLRSGQPLRLTDYGQALTERVLTPDLEDGQVKAWMAVPLVAGQRALGLLAVGNDQPGRPYTDNQLNSLVEISALVATSLDKARLFEETNARARQLAALNDVSGQLVAVESDLGALLTFVTDTAGSILNADAASLMLVTDEGLRYEVARGMGREALVGTIATGQTPAARVVATGMQQRDDSSDHALAVPLVSTGGVIGVLEVVNVAARRSFSRDDADLLATFAGQAAIAIENARLFEMTDFQLNQRVAELESMERVDVELNRSLDLAKVAEITIQSAVEFSGATAGLLGLIVPEQPYLQVVAASGYLQDDVHAEDTPGTWPADHGVVQRVIRTRRADMVLDPSYETGYVAGMGRAISQIAVPMLSGGEVSAVLLLETDREPRFNLAHLAYIQRLAEHASVAIANAQLYRELERANQSKSEFVSFVAHELKNPLTSIKGYSDILSKGVAGSLTDQQRMFITTIRSNADRMNTLVSDLNDVTKLQTDNMRIELADVPFADIATETLRPLEPQIEARRQVLDLQMPDDLPLIRADKTRMIQVLTNLVSNAHKYTPDGGQITLAAAVDASRRDNRGRPLGPVLHVQVRDTGIGMSEGDLRKLFTAYFRSDNPAARQQPGTGLGLTITQGLVVRHGGDIWAESTLGKGTVFHFTVPLATEPTA
jgi:signal transduction histidine kinase